jgi:DNA helicase-2/ATP-dependent DNA helicase PcrA
MSEFPDEKQAKVIDHRGRPLVVVAGPGSGKTRTLVERARRILSNDPASRVSFVTFTRTSRRDTKAKLEEALGKNRDNEEPDFPKVSTLHGFAKSLLHKIPEVVGLRSHFSVLVPDKEQQIVLEEVLEDSALELSPKALWRTMAKWKNAGTLEPPPGADREKFLAAANRYGELCRFYNAIDIEGLVKGATEATKSRRAIIEQLYLHVDEYQDLNRADQDLVEALLASGNHETVVVGDDDQSIYGMLRDARPEGIRELFVNPEWEKVAFCRSHRMPAHILRASQALIKKHRAPRLDKGIEIPADDGRRIPTYVCTTDAIEIELVASLINKEKRERKKNGEELSYGDFLVLCPTRAISNTFAKQLKEKWKIPVRKVTSRSIPDELWRILLILRMVARDDDLALRQWLNILEIPHTQVLAIRNAALHDKTTLFHVARDSGIETLRQFFKGLDELRTSRGDMPKLIGGAKLLAGVPTLPFDSAATSIPSLISALYEEYGLLESEEAETKTDEVFATTLHSSKGLEAEVVFIVQLSSRYMPNPSHDWDEELRVLYVGMTRAKQEMYLSCAHIFDKEKGRRKPSISPFLDLIKSHLQVRKAQRAKRGRAQKQSTAKSK